VQFHARLKHDLKTHLNQLLQSKQQEKHFYLAVNKLSLERLLKLLCSIPDGGGRGGGGRLPYKKDGDVDGDVRHTF